MHRNNLGTN